MRKLVLVVVACSSLLWVSCYNASDFNRSYKYNLMRQASFSMNCHWKRLRFVPMARNGAEVITSYGVYGCGVRAVYNLIPYSGSWVQTSISRVPAPPAKPAR